MTIERGSYILVLDLAENAMLGIGRLGTFEFPAGLYLYCGSALNGLEGRIRRHLRRDKKHHWHIDHLTAVAPVVQVWWVADGARWECRWADAIKEQGGQVVARRFGSSDCRCSTHLLWWEKGEETSDLCRILFADAGQAAFGVWAVGEDADSPSVKLGESAISPL